MQIKRYFIIFSIYWSSLQSPRKNNVVKNQICFEWWASNPSCIFASCLSNTQIHANVNVSCAKIILLILMMFNMDKFLHTEYAVFQRRYIVEIHQAEILRFQSCQNLNKIAHYNFDFLYIICTIIINKPLDKSATPVPIKFLLGNSGEPQECS